MEGWYKEDLDDRTYTGYQVCYLAGTYDVTTTDTNTSGNLQLAYNNKPLVHYAKDTESVIWDFQYNNFASGEGDQPSGNGEYHFHDWFLGRITCTGGATGDNKRRWLLFSSVQSAWPYDGTQGACRNTWFKSPQIDWTATGAVNDNSGIVFGSNTGSEAPARIYFYVTQCPITNIRTTQTPTNFNGWWLGQTAYFLAEHNVITNTNFGRSPFSAKSSEYRSCYRNIDMSAAPDQPFIPDCAGSYADGYGGGSELSYSKINYTADGNGLTAVQWGHHFYTFDDVTYPNHEKNYQFRNSVSKAPGPNGECFRSPSSWPTEVIKDIWCSEDDGIYLGAPENTQANGDWKLYAIPDDPFDSSMNLTDTEFEGTHGATLIGEVLVATTPTSVTAIAISIDQINISWTSVANEGCAIERSLTGTDGWEEVYFCPSDDGDGQGNPIVKLFSHLPNTEYYFRLRHCVSSAGSPSYSSYSSTVSTTTSTAGNIYYVAPTGGNNYNTGTANYPFATLQHAIDQASGGDIIRLQDGTHTATTNQFLTPLYYNPDGPDGTLRSFGEFTKSGTEAHPYVVEADIGATVVLDCQAGAYGIATNSRRRSRQCRHSYSQRWR